MKSKITLSALAMMLCILSYGQFPFDSNLILHYPFNGNAEDESINGFDATVNGPTLTNDRFGNPSSAYYFDGVDDFIEIPSDARFNPLTSYTLSFWMQTNQTSRFDMFTQRIGSQYPDKYNFGINFYIPNIELQFVFPNYNNELTTINYNPLDTNINFSDGDWHHFIFIKNTSNASQSIYYDNELIAQEAIYDIDFNLNGSLFIGKRHTDDSYFDGNLDDIRIYESALEATEVADLYNEFLNLNAKVSTIIHLYPNPCRSIIYCTTNTKAIHFELYTINGKELDCFESTETYIDISKLKKGSYIIKLLDSRNQSIGTKKIIKI